MEISAGISLLIFIWFIKFYVFYFQLQVPPPMFTNLDSVIYPTRFLIKREFSRYQCEMTAYKVEDSAFKLKTLGCPIMVKQSTT